MPVNEQGYPYIVKRRHQTPPGRFAKSVQEYEPQQILVFDVYMGQHHYRDFARYNEQGYAIPALHSWERVSFPNGSTIPHLEYMA
jgi:hypothetical protein